MPKVKPKATKTATKTIPKPKPKTPKLNPKEIIFVSEYIVDFDAERAALVAGYSKSMAKSKVYQWVRAGKPKPYIYEAIQKALKKRLVRIERSADEVIERLWEFSDLDKNKYNGGKTVNIKATELLARHYGLFNDKITVKTSLEDLISGRDKAKNAEEKT